MEVSEPSEIRRRSRTQSIAQRSPGRPPSPLSQAAKELLPGTGVKALCRPRHSRGSCPEIKTARKMATRTGFKIDVAKTEWSGFTVLSR